MIRFNKYRFIVLALLAFCIFQGYSDYYSEPSEPSPQEKAAFDHLLEKVKSRQHPHQVKDVLQSLDGNWTQKITCPAGSMFDQVVFNISTQQIKWDRNLTIKSKPSGVGPNDIGWYQWTYESSGENRIKTVKATNYIMLDPAVILANETNSPFDETGDEALLYHELLHGQLVMDSIVNGNGFQKKVCNCNFDLTAGDFDHQYIPGYETDFLSVILDKKGAEEPSAYVLKPEAKTPESDGNFKLPVAEASILEGVENVRINWYIPRGSNVQENQINVLVEEGKIWVRGYLKDPSQSGLLVIMIETH